MYVVLLLRIAVCCVRKSVNERKSERGKLVCTTVLKGPTSLHPPPSYLQLSPLRCLLYECVGICVIGHAAMSAVRVRVGDLYRFFCVLYFLCKRCGNNVV